MLFNQRRALDKMDQYGLDALVGAVPRNVHYASDFWSRNFEWGGQEALAAVVVPRDPAKPTTLILPEFAIANLLELPTWIPRVRVTEFLNTSALAREPEPVRLEPLQTDAERLYGEKVVGDLEPNVVTATRATLQDLGLADARVGFDDLRVAGHVARELPKLRWSDAHDVWLDIRKVKTGKEIELLRHGAQLNQAGLYEIMPLIRPGTAWREVAGRFRQYVFDHGGNLLSSQKALQFGAEYGGQYFPDILFADNDWQIRNGQTIIFEVWGQYANYAFDMSRTVHVGEPSAEYQRICDAVSAGQREAEKVLRAGISSHQAWSAISKIAYAMDVPTPRKTLVFFHSIGLDIIELPSGYPAFGRLKDFELEPDMVINFEYLYFGHTVAPYHLESTYRLKPDGAECLHSMPNQLFRVG